MTIITEPNREQWAELVRRPAFDVTQLFDVVRPIMDAVHEHGDKALHEYGHRFDGVDLEVLAVSSAEVAEACAQVPQELKEAIELAYCNIYDFHELQRNTQAPVKLETAPGVVCEQRTLPIQRVGLYVPGGQAPLFSTVLMLAVPAAVAGCEEVVLCTPPGKDGRVNPAILFAADLCGVKRIFKVGGAQAIAAMTYGTASVPKVDKIFGPGNAYVTAAKQLASLAGVAIDMPAGPSEVEVLADSSCVPAFVAADLLSQAEHGPDSQAMLVTTDAAVAEAVAAEVEQQLAALPRKEIAARSIANSRIIVLADKQACIDFTNAYGPEHLIIAMEGADAVAAETLNAGSIFLGNYSCESAGDYASGTNHTLPTMGCVRAYSSLCIDSFQRKMTLQTLTAEGIRSIGRTVELMARAEHLDAHARAMTLRMQAVSALQQEEQGTGIARLVRPNILKLKPYSSARDEYAGKAAHVFLDANESPHNAPNNRYPDPLQWELKLKIAAYKGVAPERIFLGNGSDEAIDLIFRTFCTPGVDEVAAIAPSYGMYEVCADINNIRYNAIPLEEGFQFDAESFLQSIYSPCTKVIFICSPNNPTGNLLPLEEIRKVLDIFPGMVVVDEAYIDFAPSGSSLIALLDAYPRLIVLNTFSKAWASAGIRLGMALAHPEVIGLFNKVKYPYNVNILTQRAAMERLEHMDEIRAWVDEALTERERMMQAVAALPICEHVYPSDANFFLARVNDACRIYDALVEQGIIVRNRHRIMMCENCLRITIGTPAENDELLAALKQF
ncbi:MAG: histidinol dehydrogenase [Akkermansia sp.]|nr:histidinol dehydrogenase [Akkermansia sp.]MBR2314920.1 histidinol dehydrogenase [Akkermansia sp.]